MAHAQPSPEFAPGDQPVQTDPPLSNQPAGTRGGVVRLKLYDFGILSG
jgi:hypothetical protein